MSSSTQSDPLAPAMATRHPRGGADLLTTAFATVAAMWTLGYIGRMPGIDAPPALVAAALLAALLVGGFLTGRLTARGALGGAAAGVIIAMLNLFILGSIFGAELGGQYSAWAMLWVPSTILVTAIITALAAALGARFAPALDPDANWSGRFAIVALLTTSLILIAGGFVTARDAGLAVHDWPQSFGYNMFLYPLARMTGNIYYEHAHRLFGILVGVTTIVLALHLWSLAGTWVRWFAFAALLLGVLGGASLALGIAGFGSWVPWVWLLVTIAMLAVGPAISRDSRWWLAYLALIAIVAVIAQGIMGGFRVTEAQLVDGVELARPHHETAKSSILRVAHGVYAQLFFALLTAIAVLVSSTWQRTVKPKITIFASMDRGLATTLIVLLVLQLFLGALVRHLRYDVLVHIVGATLVLFVAIGVGVRAFRHAAHFPVVRRLGLALVFLVPAQIVMGFIALVAFGLTQNLEHPHPAHVLLSTLHQVNGAALLALATAAALYAHGVLEQAPEPVLPPHQRRPRR